jgi:hypothetical protein
MESLDFEERNFILNGPKKEYRDLFVNIDPTIQGCPTTFIMQLSPAELEEVNNNGGKICLTQYTGGRAFQPISMSITPHQMQKIDLEPYFTPKFDEGSKLG